MNERIIQLHPADNVVVAVVEIGTGALLSPGGVRCRETIAAGHKVAGADIAVGQPVRKYNQVIGFASRPIQAGEHVHVHNVGLGELGQECDFGGDGGGAAGGREGATFQGIVRADGKVGTRNYVGILSSVNCSASVAKAIGDAFRGEALSDYPKVDGVITLTHGTGCAIDIRGEGLELLRRTMAGYAVHANLAGVLMVGLGCEVNQVGEWLRESGLETGGRLRTLVIHDRGVSSTVEEGIGLVGAMLKEANLVEREEVAADGLVVGLQCGGSDAFSGIGANPALGAAVDLLVREGGTAILSETPEIYGAQHLLTRRAVSREVGEKLLARIDWWKDYLERNQAEMDNNPSPGNKVGGLTTIWEKSLGAVAKSGTTKLMDVYRYGEAVRSKGVVFMDSPGYDPVSVTGQVASGANLVCFTTGRGSLFGCKPVPSIKLASNTPMYERMHEDMDVNCGEIIDGGATVGEMGERIFRLMLETASGTRTKSEAHGFGEEGFVPWQVGAIL